MGRVKGLRRIVTNKGMDVEYPEKLLSPNGIKYKSVCLHKNGVRKYFLVHRLVGIAFIPNPENKPEVNHKLGNKGDNRATELEWSTRIENEQHAIKIGLKDTKGGNHPLSKRIGMYDLSGNLLDEFEHVRGAMIKHGFKTLKFITDTAKGRRDSAYNYKWGYL